MKPVFSKNELIILQPFYKDGKPLSNGPEWGMSLLSAGSMRFRWSENNNNRIDFLNNLCGMKRQCGAEKCEIQPVPLELIHSKIVYDVHNESDTFQKQGDGMITDNKKLLPVITVADCMPIFLYDAATGVFGSLHSGWKGTGIVASAIELAEKNYGSKPENLCVVLGPHIGSCCYTVDEERAEYFINNFTPDCIKEDINNKTEKYRFHLSLQKANLAVLKKTCIPKENIFCANMCTSCTKFNDGSFVFGSSRRQTAEAVAAGKDVNVHSGAFTVQAGFCGWIKKD